MSSTAKGGDLSDGPNPRVIILVFDTLEVAAIIYMEPIR